LITKHSTKAIVAQKIRIKILRAPAVAAGNPSYADGEGATAMGTVGTASTGRTSSAGQM
jgi:hypothetical protein